MMRGNVFESAASQWRWHECMTLHQQMSKCQKPSLALLQRRRKGTAMKGQFRHQIGRI